MNVRTPVAKEGWPFIFVFIAVAAAVSWLWPYPAVMIPFWILVLWCVYFFRDPEREPPLGNHLIIAPADGRVVAVEEVESAPLLHRPARKVSIFMNVFNVHVNRMPASGTILNTAYHQGKFLNAALDKASVQNERMEVLMQLDSGEKIAFVQIAGLVARRIVCYLKPEQKLKKGERFGLIRFGSRVDIYLSLDSRIQCTLGDHTVAGETIIAYQSGGVERV
ncbi:phosphatidylserine decarboxylase family protein [Magnetococcales bacterium HHB-1]